MELSKQSESIDNANKIVYSLLLDRTIKSNDILFVRTALANPNVTMGQFKIAIERIFENFRRGYKNYPPDPYLRELKNVLFQDVGRNPNPRIRTEGRKFLERYLRANETY